MRQHGAKCVLAAAVVGLVMGGAAAQAGGLEVWGPPAFDVGTGTGLKNVAEFPGFSSINNSGVAVGSEYYYVNGVCTNYCFRAVRWDGVGNAVELANPGAVSDSSSALAINDAGTAVGYCMQSGSIPGVPARWDAGSTAVVALAWPDSSWTSGMAKAINSSGVNAGEIEKQTGTYTWVTRAVRWDASGVATELGNLGAGLIGARDMVYAMNDAGTIIGSCSKYVSGVQKGNRAVRWDASGTAVTELGVLGTSGDGVTGNTTSNAFGINNAGTIVGSCLKYVGGVNKGNRPVRWDAGATTATELGVLGTASDGGSGQSAMALGINEAGTVVGYCSKYVGGVSMGARAVRWDAGSTTAVELAVLGTAADGSTVAQALAVSKANIAVGDASKYVNGQSVGKHAVMWLPDASIIDLNDLKLMSGVGGGTWTLETAMAMSEDGWACGHATFDPDGDGPVAAYGRIWTAQVGLGGEWLNTSGVNNTWGKGANWSTGTPAIQLDATFATDAAYKVGFDGDATARKVEVAAGAVTMALGSYALAADEGVVIDAGARLAANGTIVGDVVNDGTFAPGNSPGSSVIEGSYVDTGTLEMEIASPSLMDTLTVTGDVELSGTVKVVLYGGYVPSGPAVFDLLDWSGTMTDTAGFDFSQAVLPAGLAWDTSMFASTGEVAVVALPEPGTLMVMGLGLAGVMLRRRR